MVEKNLLSEHTHTSLHKREYKCFMSKFLNKKKFEKSLKMVSWEIYVITQRCYFSLFYFDSKRNCLICAKLE